MILKLEPGGWGAETARPASASTEPSLGLDHRDAAELVAQRVLGGLLQPELDRGVDRAALAAGDARDHAVAEAQRRAAAPAEAVVVDALEPGRLGARDAGDRGAGRVGVQQPAAGVVDACRAWARRRCGGGPPRPCAARAAPAPATRRRARCRSSASRGTSRVPLSVPKSLVLTVTGTWTFPPLSSGPIVPIVIFSTPAALLARR